MTVGLAQRHQLSGREFHTLRKNYYPLMIFCNSYSLWTRHIWRIPLGNLSELTSFRVADCAGSTSNIGLKGALAGRTRDDSEGGTKKIEVFHRSFCGLSPVSEMHYCLPSMLLKLPRPYTSLFENLGT